MPGSFAHAVHHPVEALDLSGFDAHYCNDANGATAYAPSMLLKAVLLAYSQGIISSRSIERACRDNVLFIVITGDAKPHFATTANSIIRSRDAIESVFAQVLVILGKSGLIGRERRRRSCACPHFPTSQAAIERVEASLGYARGFSCQGREAGTRGHADAGSTSSK